MTPGSSIGPYRVLRHLGSGGMGDVWLAEDSRLHRQVALKTVKAAGDDPASRTRLLREARAAAALNDPHIATVYDVLEEQGDVVVVFEFVEGETLSQRIARGSIPAPEAVEIGCQISTALSSAHAHGIIHRDLKPANIIIGAHGHLKVLDFGIARILELGTTRDTATTPWPTASAGGFIGTAAYAAPEQMISSAVDERADLYALGVVLFEMLSGKRPFRGSDPIELATAKLKADAPTLSSTGHHVPAPLENLVAWLLERDRDRRPASANDVLSELRSLYGPKPPGPLPWAGSRSLNVVLAAVLIVIVGGYGLWVARDTPPSAANASGPPVIAVLPLTNSSGDSSKDFVAAGIAESLISSLAAVPSVTVLSRASVAEARTRLKDNIALVKDLGATYFVDGGVQESGGVLRVSLSLVKPDGSVAWGENLEGTFDQIFDLQARLATALTSALVVRVSASERERMNEPPTSSPAALQKYWQGRALFDRRDTKGNLEGAIAAYAQAIGLDSGFALAHAALGEAYWFMYLDTRDPAIAQKATDEGYTALRLDANAPAVRYTLAVSLAGTGKPDEAISELRQALAMQPNYDDARRQLGQVLVTQGHVDEGIAEFRKAIAARPDSWANYSQFGRSMFAAGRNDEAIAAFQKVTELQPGNALGFQQLGTVYQRIGDQDRALDNYKRALAIRPIAQAYSNMGMLYHQRRDYRSAVDAYRSAIGLRPNSAATHRNLGDALMKLGERKDAVAAYHTAVGLVDADLKVNPRDATALASSAVYLAKAGDLAEARARINQAIKIAPKDNVVRHGEAVVNVLSGKAAEAVESIRLAIDYGYARSAIEEDDEFESLRSNASFRQLVAH